MKEIAKNSRYQQTTTKYSYQRNTIRIDQTSHRKTTPTDQKPDNRNINADQPHKTSLNKTKIWSTFDPAFVAYPTQENRKGDPENMWKMILALALPMIIAAGQAKVDEDQNDTGTDDLVGHTLLYISQLIRSLLYGTDFPQPPAIVKKQTGTNSPLTAKTK